MQLQLHLHSPSHSPPPPKAPPFPSKTSPFRLQPLSRQETSSSHECGGTAGVVPSAVGVEVHLEEHWYPVSLVEDLDPKLTTLFQLLGREVVLWTYPKSGDWVAFDDKCPHRLASLSVTGRRDRAKPLPFKVKSSGPWGFAGSDDGSPRISVEFIAPCYYINKVEIDTKLPIVGEQTWKIWICSFNIPMAPGKTRSIVCSAKNFFQFTMPRPACWQVA